MKLHRLNARFPGKCSASGEAFAAGAEILHNPDTRRCYLPQHAPADAEISDSPLTVAYKQGLEAGKPGAPLTQCPYPPSPESHAWKKGLLDAGRSPG